MYMYINLSLVTLLPRCSAAAVGCANIVPPPNAWAERSGDRLTVRCNLTTHHWFMACKGTAWVGKMADCSQGNAPPRSARWRTVAKVMMYWVDKMTDCNQGDDVLGGQDSGLEPKVMMYSAA